MPKPLLQATALNPNERLEKKVEAAAATTATTAAAATTTTTATTTGLGYRV